MANRIEVRVFGVEEISKNLRMIASHFDTAVAMPALVEAMEIVRDEAQANAALYVDRLTTRTYIPDNIVLKRRVKYSKQHGVAAVSVTTKKMKGSGNDTFYWWFVELGTRRQRARPFLRKAAFDNVGRVVNTFASRARHELILLGKYPFAAHKSYGNEMDEE